MLRKILVNAAFIGMVGTFFLANCPIDGASAYFTGVTKVDVSGVLLKQHRCNQFGHVFWAR